MKAKLLIFSFLLFLNIPAYASLSGEDVNELKLYVEGVIDKGYDLVQDENLTDEERHRKVSKMIRSHLHLDWMARYALGRNRRMLSDAKISEFARVYSNFVVKVYADLSSSYNGEKAQVKNIKQIDDDMFIVNMEIIRPSDQDSIKIDYLIHKIDNATKNKYRIGDIITEGISVLNSQQSEFNSVISSKGIDALIADLKQRANKT